MTTSLHLWGVPELTGPPAQVLVPERRHQLLTWLAVRSGEWLPRDDAAMLLWPGHEPALARRNLRKVLVEARALPGVRGMDVQDHMLRWTVGTDLKAFDAALHADPPRTAEALALRRGPLMAGLDQPANPAWSDWLRAERARLDGRWQRVAHLHLLALADPAARCDWAQRLLVLDPLDDGAMAAWIEGCLAQGAVGAARQAWAVYAERLAQELGIEPPSHLRAMLDRATAQSLHTGAAALAKPPPAVEARAPAGFVGRRTELAELGARLAQPGQRLLTLLGPGGVGKSRLAQQLLTQATPGSALWVEMHDLGDTAALAARLARRLAIGIDDRRDTALQLGDALGAGVPGHPHLLILDNAEHLRDLPAWLARLLAAAPTLQVLVTSRVRLLLENEQVLRLAGLALPDEDSRDLEAAPAFDAVRLFVQRAESAQPGFELARHLDAVLEIVQTCDGWPLAIELAAAWVRLLPPEEIARGVLESVDLLEHDPANPGQPARPEHRSLRGVIERSFDLLAPREGEALEALAIFRGDFTRSAAQAAAAVALPLLASLVDKSLLAVDEEGRFRLHPLVAALAAQRMHADADRAARLQEQHAVHFLRRLAEAGSQAASDPRAVDELVDSCEADLRQAWQHALALRRAELVAPALAVLSGHFQRRGRLRDGAALLQPALQWPLADSAGHLVQGCARAAVANLWHMAFEPSDAVQQLADSGLAHALQAGDKATQSTCVQVRAASDLRLGRLTSARAGFEQALALANEIDLVANELTCRRHLANLSIRSGDFETGLTLLRQAQARARETGNVYEEAVLLQAEAVPHLNRGNWPEAERVSRLSLQRAAQLGARQLLLHGRMMRGCALIELGRLAEAETDLRQASSDALALGQPAHGLCANAYLALSGARAGRLDEAERALRDVARQARDAGWTGESMRALLFHGEVLARRGNRLAAAAAWRAVAADPAIAAGERESARLWLAEMALSVQEAAQADAVAPDAERALAALLDDPTR